MTVEQLVVALYLAVLVLVGYWSGKRTKSLSGYMLGGRNIGPAVTALTMQATAMSGYMFMGGPALAYTHGYFALWYAVGDAGGSILNLGILGRRMRILSAKLGSLTPIEYLEDRFESTAVRVYGAFVSLVFLASYVFAQFIAGGKALAMLVDLPYPVALAVGVVVILIYTVMGGYLAVVWNDFIQGMVMVVSMVGILVAAMTRVGGFTALNLQMAMKNPLLVGIWGTEPAFQGAWGVVIGAVLLYAIGYMGLPHSVVRHMSLRDTQAVRGAIMISAVWNQFFIYTPYLLGMIGMILLPNLQDPEMVIPALAYEIFPPVAAAIVMVALMAAVLSTADSLLIQGGSILSRDVYQRFIKPQATEKEMLLVSRLLVLVVAVIGYVVAVREPPSVFGVVIFAFGTLGSTFMVPYLAAVYDRKGHGKAVLASMIGGSVASVVWTACQWDLVTKVHPFFAGVVISFVCYMMFRPFGGKGPSQKVLSAYDEMLDLVGKKSSKRYRKPSPMTKEAMAVREFLQTRQGREAS